ncbi:hypothetical protein FQR65_LT13055 [Abscondita terminalis]|nr:hypothetical protein FQR65_LT13055 [Abscondita terminalis]
MFALMPVEGVTGSGKIRFRWKSWRVMYSILLTLSLFLPMYACLYDVATHEPSIDRITAVAFFANSICVHCIFLKLAMRWPELMKKWQNVEKAMKAYGYPKNLNFQINSLTVTILGLAVVEHVLSVINHLLEADELKTNGQDIFEYFFAIIAFPQVYALAEYSLWSGFFLQIITFISTFSWNYIDLFVMLMSVGLAARFRQVADRIDRYSNDKVCSKNKDEYLWRGLRNDYARLSGLCKTLNGHISGLVALSFTSNLFYILVQLFYSLKKMDDAVGKVYFFFSFGFLLGRAVCVCLYGAWIHDESTRPLLTLNTVSSEVYNDEIKRLTTHVCYDAPALTGKNFFTLTRELILDVSAS